MNENSKLKFMEWAKKAEEDIKDILYLENKNLKKCINLDIFWNFVLK